MYRAFPNLKGIDIKTKFGHRPIFPPDVNDRPSKKVYISRHYKLRSIKQASYKMKRVRRLVRVL